MAEWRILEAFRGKSCPGQTSDLLQVSRRFALAGLVKLRERAAHSAQSKCFYCWWKAQTEARRRDVDAKASRKAAIRRVVRSRRCDLLDKAWGMSVWREGFTLRRALWQLEAANVEELHLQLEEKLEAANERFVSMLRRWHRRCSLRHSLELWRHEALLAHFLLV